MTIPSVHCYSAFQPGDEQDSQASETLPFFSSEKYYATQTFLYATLSKSDLQLFVSNGAEVFGL